jgi:DNA (cytosine-5)-methyltransferase 1
VRLLDLFCGAGGAAMGYSRAGFTEIVGVDNRPMPRYPFTFFLGDALEYVAAHRRKFDAIHASPPCQRYSEQTPLAYRTTAPDLIRPTREALRLTGVPWVIENVENARSEMRASVMLCGTMFDLNLWRHRYFENEFGLWLGPASCHHSRRPVILHAGNNSRMGPVSPTGSTRRKTGRFEWPVEICRDAMGIPWMTRMELDQAIPPAYTEFIGRQLLTHLACLTVSACAHGVRP